MTSYLNEKQAQEKAACQTKLERVSPAIAAALEDARRNAEEAAARVEKIQSRAEIVKDLENRLVGFAKMNSSVARLRELAGEASQDPKATAASVVAAFFLSHESPCTATTSAYAYQLERFAQMQTMAPYLPAILAERERQLAEVLKGIKETASREKVNLKSLIALMRDEASEINQGAMRDAAVHSLFCDNYFPTVE